MRNNVLAYIRIIYIGLLIALYEGLFRILNIDRTLVVYSFLFILFILYFVLYFISKYIIGLTGHYYWWFIN